MNRRTFLKASATVGASLGAASPALAADTSRGDELPLGHGHFRYRLNRDWGRLDRAATPVEDCHSITADAAGRIVLLNTSTRNNLLVYTTSGELVTKYGHRFPSGHALQIDRRSSGERFWITDNQLQLVSLSTPEDRELRSLPKETVLAHYATGEKYHPTNVAVMPDGDFFVSDGYGSSRILHFDPDWKFVGMFGGVGDAPENLNQPHAVWLDTRGARHELLVCDRGNEALKWFSTDGQLLRVLALPGARPCNVASFADGHLIVPCLNGMILVLDAKDRVISVIGGEPPRYENGVLQRVIAYNYAFNHPHDAYIDGRGDIYVAQWNSNRSYPLKLERLPA